MMRKYGLSLILASTLIMSGCATFTKDNDRSKALAMASEHGPALLVMASVPLKYYCEHNEWPKEPHLSKKESLLLRDIRHLFYHQDDEDYAAKFEIHSFIPDDDFYVDWHMTIVPPEHTKKGMQIIPIAFTAKQYNIFIPFEFEYDCAIQETA